MSSIQATPAARSFEKRSDWISASVVGSHLGFVFIPVFTGAYFGPSLWWLALWAWCGGFLHGILNLTHECSHFHIFKARQTNEVFGRWVLGAFLFVGFDRYRQIHWLHHRWLGTERDPKYSYRIDVTGKKIFTLFIRSLFLIEAMNKFLYVHSDKIEKQASGSRLAFFRIVVGQATLLLLLFLVARMNPSFSTAFAALSAVLAHGIIYMYGLLSLTIYVANLRAIAEHQPFKNGPNRMEGQAALRNLKSNYLTELLFGSYGFSLHATHHENASIPFYHLPDLTQELALEKPELAAEKGYFSALREATKTRVYGAPERRSARG